MANRYEVIVSWRGGDEPKITSLLEENNLNPKRDEWERMRDASTIFGEGLISDELKTQIEDLGASVRNYPDDSKKP